MSETPDNAAATKSLEPPRGRLWLGAAVFVGGFFAPALIPLVTAAQLPGSAKTVIDGLGLAILRGLEQWTACMTTWRSTLHV